jgi:hypothetical protein
LKPPGIEKLINRVLECEGEATHWSLKDRLVLVNDVLDGFAAAGMLFNMLHVLFCGQSFVNKLLRRGRHTLEPEGQAGVVP